MKKVLPLVIIACLSTSAVSAKNSCKDLQIGESLRVKKSPKKSKSGIEMKYTLNRVSENGYDVFINPDFLPHKSYDGKFPSNVTGTITLRKLRPFVNQLYKKRFNYCFGHFNKKLYDGYYRKINLKVWDKELHSSIKAPPKVKIKIVSSLARSNSRNYASNASCSTIVHEVLHILGLPDEYREKVSNWNPNILGRMFRPLVNDRHGKLAFNCRSMGKGASIMANPHNTQYYRRNIFSKHIDVILYPNCTKKNETFYKCAKNAYRTSKDHGGFLGCRKNTPDICGTTNWIGI